MSNEYDFFSCNPKDKKCYELRKHIEPDKSGYTFTNPTNGKKTTGLTLKNAVKLYERFNLANPEVRASKIIKNALRSHNEKFKHQTLKRLHLRNKLKGIPSTVIPNIKSYLSKKKDHSNYHGKPVMARERNSPLVHSLMQMLRKRYTPKLASKKNSPQRKSRSNSRSNSNNMYS